MAEQADARVSGARGRKPMRVRFPPPRPASKTYDSGRPHGRPFSYIKAPRTGHEPRPHGHGKEGTVAEDNAAPAVDQTAEGNAAPERDYNALNGTAKDLLAKSPTDG